MGTRAKSKSNSCALCGVEGNMVYVGILTGPVCISCYNKYMYKSTCRRHIKDCLGGVIELAGTEVRLAPAQNLPKAGEMATDYLYLSTGKDSELVTALCQACSCVHKQYAPAIMSEVYVPPQNESEPPYAGVVRYKINHRWARQGRGIVQITLMRASNGMAGPNGAPQTCGAAAVVSVHHGDTLELIRGCKPYMLYCPKSDKRGDIQMNRHPYGEGHVASWAMWECLYGCALKQRNSVGV